MRFALDGVGPASLRVTSSFLGALVLIVFAAIQRHSVKLPFGRAWLHVAIASTFNISGFGLLVAFAQLSAATSRVAILVYTMPIWAALLARPVLGERLNLLRSLSLVLCVVGIGILVYPLAQHGIPNGVMFALLSGMSWAAGTVYLKWARIPADALTIAIWQFVVAFVAVLALAPLIEGGLHLWPATWLPQFGVLFTGIIGSGLSYYLWFKVMGRLSATAASLGILSVPPIGVASSALLLGEIPTVTDWIGFLLIFGAAACVLLQPHQAPVDAAKA